VLSEKAVAWALRRDPELNDQQQAAVRQTCLREQTISVITGLPGTGKTRVLAAVASAHEKTGREVVGTALAGKAARNLEAATRIHSHTVAALLRDLEATAADNVKHHLQQLGRAALGKRTYKLDRVRLTEKSLLVVDEAGMLDSATLRRLLVHAERAHAKVVLCGDPDQLQPIGAGAPLRTIAQRLGGASLTQITRQTGEDRAWAVESILAIRRGDGEAALRAYAERGLLHVEKDSRAAAEKLVEEWKKEGVKKPEENLILASQNVNVDRINRLAQDARRQAGELGGFRARVGKDYFYLGTPKIKLKDGTRLYQGDRVLFTHTSGTLSNGDLGTILKIDPVRKQFTVRLDDQKKPITVSYARGREHLALGYCLSTHRAQGVDRPNVLVLAGGSMQDREISFVQASRAKNQTRWFASRLEAGANLEALCRQFGHSRAKNLAHDVLAEVGRPTQVQKQT
jgi:ATP-dependent exoDNAse (exonuclease V) alpha subunit